MKIELYTPVIILAMAYDCVVTKIRIQESTARLVGITDYYVLQLQEWLMQSYTVVLTAFNLICSQL